jgi:peptide-methionine (R)-S-oxide reductase
MESSLTLDERPWSCAGAIDKIVGGLRFIPLFSPGELRTMFRRALSCATFAGLTLATFAVSVYSQQGTEKTQAGTEKGKQAAEKPKKVFKTDQEWAKLLTRTQYMVTRHKATEPAFSGKLYNNHAAGVYRCICCDEELFTSRTKFDSGTGWPSFYAPVDVNRITTQPDYSMPGEVRVEVECSTCGAHLGHVFADGPPPTGQRFCMNSASLKFIKDPPSTKSKTKAKSKTQPKATAKPGSSPKAASKETDGAGSKDDEASGPTTESTTKAPDPKTKTTKRP